MKLISLYMLCVVLYFFFFQAEDGIRDLVRSRGLGDVYKRQGWHLAMDAGGLQNGFRVGDWLIEPGESCASKSDQAVSLTDDQIGVLIALALRHGEAVDHSTLRNAVSYTHLRAHETVLDLVCRLLLEKKKT